MSKNNRSYVRYGRAELTPEMIAARSTPEPNTGCWLWLAHCNPQGYGIVRVDGKIIKAHRASWITHKGVIPTGMLVCHKCDTPECVNPNHLFLGTSQQNSDDMVEKGRSPLGPKLFGEKNRQAKLSDAQALIIRNSVVRGCDLAAQFGVSPSTICMIRSGARRSVI